MFSFTSLLPTKKWPREPASLATKVFWLLCVSTARPVSTSAPSGFERLQGARRTVLMSKNAAVGRYKTSIPARVTAQHTRLPSVCIYSLTFSRIESCQALSGFRYLPLCCSSPTFKMGFCSARFCSACIFFSLVSAGRVDFRSRCLLGKRVPEVRKVKSIVWSPTRCAYLCQSCMCSIGSLPSLTNEERRS